jgi:hypothetical protein
MAPDVFDEIENELIRLKGDQTIAALIGDYNACSGVLSGYIMADENLLQDLVLRPVNTIRFVS